MSLVLRLSLRIHAALLLTGCFLSATNADPPTTSAAAPHDREAQLWNEIVALHDPAVTPVDNASLINRQIDKIQTYLTLYPGGAHRDAAIRLELEARFALAVVAGQPFATLQRRVADLLAQPPGPQSEGEVAYWRVLLDTLSADPTTVAQPAVRARQRREAWLAYVRDHPLNCTVPSLVADLFSHARQTGDGALECELVALVETHHPDHPMTEELAGRLFQREFVGGHVGLPLGRPLIVVVWASHDPAARDAVVALRDSLRPHDPKLLLLSVSLDPDRSAAATASRSLGVNWPLYCDELGWGGHFVRRWGIRDIPSVIRVDPAGRLVGVAGPTDWHALVGDLVYPPPSSGN